jgi:hypothetical protein
MRDCSSRDAAVAYAERVRARVVAQPCSANACTVQADAADAEARNMQDAPGRSTAAEALRRSGEEAT